MSGFNTFCEVTQFTCQRLIAEKQRVAEGMETPLDVMKESADRFPSLKSAISEVNAFLEHYEVSIEWMTVTHN